MYYAIDGGIGGGCGDLCHALAVKTGEGKYVEIACNLLCDLVGFEAFVSICQK